MKVTPINIKAFKSKYKVKDLSPFEMSMFDDSDMKELQDQAGIVSLDKKVVELASLIPQFLQDPVRIIKNFSDLIRSYSKRVLMYYSTKTKKISDSYPFTDYALKANIVASFYPKTFLEIGTAHGWAIVCCKALLPKTKCFTIDLDTSSESGKIIRKKKADIHQYWGDSTTFDYSIFPKIDVAYIDGDHTYESVYADLVTTNKLAKKMIILDDYIPYKDAPRGDIFQYLWFHEHVSRAVQDFLKKYSKDFIKAYWLKNTGICILIK